MKKFSLFLIVGILLTLAGCGTPNYTPTPDTTSLYENKELGFSFSFPKTRNFKENTYGSKVIFFSPEGKNTIKTNVGVSVQTLSKNYDSLDTIFTANKNMLSSTKSDFSIISEEDTTIENNEAKKRTIQFKEGSYTIKQEQVFFITDKKAYTITYTATKDMFNDYLKQAEYIIGTFSFSSLTPTSK